MNVLAIDPGNEKSGWVMYDTDEKRVIDSRADAPNSEVLLTVQWFRGRVAIEYTPPYTMQTANGRSFVPNQVVLTAIEIGRFIQCRGNDSDAVLISRTDVKKHLLGRSTGNDSHVRQALLDRFGGTIKKAKGTKKAPGPLYGVKSHAWAALAVAVTYHETALTSQIRASQGD